jgi:hypothetical protein
LPASLGVVSAAVLCGIIVAGVAEGIFDAAPGYLVLAVDALGVDLEQDRDAVPGPLGDLGGRGRGPWPDPEGI